MNEYRTPFDGGSVKDSTVAPTVQNCIEFHLPAGNPNRHCYRRIEAPSWARSKGKPASALLPGTIVETAFTWRWDNLTLPSEKSWAMVWQCHNLKESQDKGIGQNQISLRKDGEFRGSPHWRGRVCGDSKTASGTRKDWDTWIDNPIDPAFLWFGVASTFRTRQLFHDDPQECRTLYTFQSYHGSQTVFISHKGPNYFPHKNPLKTIKPPMFGLYISADMIDVDVKGTAINPRVRFSTGPWPKSLEIDL